MNRYRFAALALAGCAVLSVAACTAGVTAAPPATTAPASTAAASPTHTYSASATTNPPGAKRMITIGGSVSFPVPADAKVIENVASGQQIVVLFNSVTPADVSRFYATALPQAGYVVSGNSVVDQSSGTVAFVQFSGHGYKGNIGSLSHFSGAGVTLAGLGTKNVTTITLMPK